MWTAVPLGIAGAGDREERSLCHRGSGSLVDLGGTGTGAARRTAAAPRLESHRRCAAPRLRGFAALALVYGMCLWLVAPRFDRRGVEWAFYESVGRGPATMPLTFLYDDWDRLPYECPFGSFPHDLAVRLFYLGRPACWHQGTDSLLERHHAAACGVRADEESVVAIGSTALDRTEFFPAPDPRPNRRSLQPRRQLHQSPARESPAARASAGPAQRASLEEFFLPQVLDTTRLVVLSGTRVENPPFYVPLRRMGFTDLPNFATMAAVVAGMWWYRIDHLAWLAAGATPDKLLIEDGRTYSIP